MAGGDYLSRISRVCLSASAGCALIYAGGLWASSAMPSAPGRLEEIVRVLEAVPAGEAVLDRARKYWGLERRLDVASKLRWGPVSKTDAVLTRHFDPKTGEETRERIVTVYLKTGQGLRNSVLDLAHELIHATTDATWDPYDPQLTAARYVKISIEGPGGEAAALVQECRVALDLSLIGDFPLGRCKRYLDEGDMSRDAVVADFYRVGKWMESLEARFGGRLRLFPLLSDEEPTLYSSTGRSPYPVSLAREFDEISRVACRNSRRRLGTLREVREQASAGREPASVKLSAALKFLASRCSVSGE